MNTTIVQFSDDVPRIRRYLASRVKAYASTDSIAALEIGFQLCQNGLVVINFDTRKKHKRDGEWTKAMDGKVLKVPRWRRAYEAAEDHGISFVMLDGKPKRLPPNAGDVKVGAIFGNTLLTIVKDAIAAGIFRTLPLREDCQLDVNEFDWMYAWPTIDADLGRKNVIRKMRPARLPG